MSTHIRIILVSAVCLALLIVASVSFPMRSGAQHQTTTPATTPRKQYRDEMFVPGEVLVRYRTESMAKSKGASIRIAARSGRLFSLDLKRTHGSNLLPGLRLARVAPEDTLDAVAALRQQPDVLDAGLIVGCQKIEHYEIAGYGSVVTFAKMLGDEESARILARTLDEEEKTDKRLTEIAESSINMQAAHGV